ncbi:MAG TPA: AAA family ATPase [Caldilineae bacterium]|nr:AAA family ATPase [Caldilineae bacterium]
MNKLAITGKGGVGKTTLASVLAYLYARDGRRVLAIDADPAANLALSLGFPPELAERITPIAEMEDLIYERTGAKPGTVGGWFRLNPRVDDIPDRFSAEHRGIRLLRLGTVKQGGSGCLCPENALLRALVTHLLLGRDEVVIMDMEAGVEHLGRATAQAVDALIVVVEPGRRSLGTAHLIRDLAGDIGLRRVYVVANKMRDERDRAFIESQARAEGFEVLGYLPADPRVIEADFTGQAVFDAAPEFVRAVEEVKQRLETLSPSEEVSES